MKNDLKESKCCKCNNKAYVIDYSLVHDKIENNLQSAIYLADEFYGTPQDLAMDYEDDILRAYLHERKLIIQECLRFLNSLCLPTIQMMGYTCEPPLELMEDEQ